MPITFYSIVLPLIVGVAVAVIRAFSRKRTES
jgi:hypothetical protein